MRTIPLRRSKLQSPEEASRFRRSIMIVPFLTFRQCGGKSEVTFLLKNSACVVFNDSIVGVIDGLIPCMHITTCLLFALTLTFFGFPTAQCRCHCPRLLLEGLCAPDCRLQCHCLERNLSSLC